MLTEYVRMPWWLKFLDRLSRLVGAGMPSIVELEVPLPGPVGPVGSRPVLPGELSDTESLGCHHPGDKKAPGLLLHPSVVSETGLGMRSAIRQPFSSAGGSYSDLRRLRPCHNPSLFSQELQ